MKDIYEIAQQRVEKKKGFYRHFRAFLIVSLLLLFANLIPFFIEWGNHPNAPISEVLEELFVYFPYWYAQYPIIGWGIGVFVHFLVVFGFGSKLDKWEEKALEREMKSMRKRKHMFPEEERMELREMETTKASNRKWDDSELV